MPTPVLLSYGMGLESTTPLVRWLLEPASRDFDLADLTVISAQTGEEYPTTQTYVEEVVFPLLRAHGVRTVQVARAGQFERDGITVLDDTTEPWDCHIAGDYRLGDEMLTSGTVPQYVSGRRRCSMKYKGWPIEQWVTRTFGHNTPYRHVLGFSNEELFRVERDLSFTPDHVQAEFPLVTWGWGRQACEDYLIATVGAAPHRSACTFCPFSQGRPAFLARYRAQPELAVRGLLLEHVSLCLNPRMSLYPGGKTLRGALMADGNTDALAHFQAARAAQEWGVYHVRRLYYPNNLTWRSVERISRRSYGACTRMLTDLAVTNGTTVTHDPTHDIRRVWLHSKDDDESYPRREELFVVCPAIVADKARPGFTARWAQAAFQQQTLLEVRRLDAPPTKGATPR